MGTDKRMTAEEIAKAVELILIEEGQHDKRFKLGEWIKYTPYEVRELILKHKDKLEGRTQNG